MARIVWSDLGTQPGNAFLIVAEIASDFGGGPAADDPFDTARLRFAANLMVRTCTQSKLVGDFAVQPLRDSGALLIHCALTEPADFARLCEIVDGSDLEATPWRGLRRFLLDEARHELLLAVAGPPDSRGPVGAFVRPGSATRRIVSSGAGYETRALPGAIGQRHV